MTNLVMTWEEELQMEILKQEVKETITVQDAAYVGYDLSILASNEEDEEEDEDYDEEDEGEDEEEEDEDYDEEDEDEEEE